MSGNNTIRVAGSITATQAVSKILGQLVASESPQLVDCRGVDWDHEAAKALVAGMAQFHGKVKGVTFDSSLIKKLFDVPQVVMWVGEGASAVKIVLQDEENANVDEVDEGKDKDKSVESASRSKIDDAEQTSDSLDECSFILGRFSLEAGLDDEFGQTQQM